MKKLLLAVIALFAVTLSASAQEQNAIGLRLGYGAEISYQRFLGPANRLEVDLGVPGFNSLEVSGVYQWHWNIPAADGLAWYAGPGAALGLYDFKAFSLGVIGQVGLEYNFRIPLTLSIDYRPGIYVLPNVGFGWTSFALGVRYRF